MILLQQINTQQQMQESPLAKYGDPRTDVKVTYNKDGNRVVVKIGENVFDNVIDTENTPLRLAQAIAYSNDTSREELNKVLSEIYKNNNVLVGLVDEKVDYVLRSQDIILRDHIMQPINPNAFNNNLENRGTIFRETLNEAIKILQESDGSTRAPDGKLKLPSEQEKER